MQARKNASCVWGAGDDTDESQLDWYPLALDGPQHTPSTPSGCTTGATLMRWLVELKMRRAEGLRWSEGSALPVLAAYTLQPNPSPTHQWSVQGCAEVEWQWINSELIQWFTKWQVQLVWFTAWSMSNHEPENGAEKSDHCARGECDPSLFLYSGLGYAHYRVAHLLWYLLLINTPILL